MSEPNTNEVEMNTNDVQKTEETKEEEKPKDKLQVFIDEHEHMMFWICFVIGIIVPIPWICIAAFTKPTTPKRKCIKFTLAVLGVLHLMLYIVAIVAVVIVFVVPSLNVCKNCTVDKFDPMCKNYSVKNCVCI